MSDWIVNKGRKRAPFKAGTLIDVKLRNTRHDDGLEIKLGVVCGPGHIDDWAIDNCNGDVLEYREHEPALADDSVG
ncbi:hypothetical protein BN110_029 [Yersinia phage phiR8-01]|uniref:Uncharacterized protein n=1 Tax=Yersinia phage phiR8-01 TaxID=1206556 RepID=I7KQP5_9CAUD|nr:hypothetical protein HOT05_gp19 [Yersinia phage phiR8-01]CCI88400.2 hypothetical protein BN110_029 [Yersinia phage phiR8-01]